MRRILALLLAGLWLAAAGPCPMGPGVPCPSVRQVTIPLTTALPSGWPFARAGNTATTLVNGVVTPVNANIPRFPTDVNGTPLEYLNEPAATNIYLNSQAPATQTITVTAQAYTLSFYGTGTIALSGTYTGTLVGTGAGDLVQLTFTPTAGALVATLTGTVTNVQVEAGSFATSRIITAGSPVTRNADNLTVPLSLYPWWQTPRGEALGIDFVSSGVPQTNLFVFKLYKDENNYLQALLHTTNTLTVMYKVAGVSVTSSTFNLAAIGAKNTLGLIVSASGVAIGLNGVAQTPIANAGTPFVAPTLYLGQNGGNTGVSAIHIPSVTLRGPSSAAWLQGGNY